MRFADGIYLRGLYETAVLEYLALLRDYPGSEHAPAALYRTGESYRQMGNPTGAIRFYKQLAAQFPKSEQVPRADLRRAELALLAERPAEAIAILEGLVSHPSPEISAAAMYYLGLSHMRSSDSKKASAAYRQMLAAHGTSPYSAFAALDLATLHASDKNNAAQMEAWFEQAQAAAATASAKAEVLYRWGDWAYRNEHYAQAADLLQSLLVEFPEERRARDARLAAAWSLYFLERVPEALTLAQRIEQEASDAETAASGVYLQANALRKMNRDGEALSRYEVVVRDYPGTRFSVRAAYEIMVTRFKRGDFEQALVVAPAQPEALQEADVRWMRAECERELGRLESARARYEALVKDFPKSPHAVPSLLRLGEMARAEGRHEVAATWFRLAAEESPQSDEAHLARKASALARMRAGDAKGALADWNELLAQKLSSEQSDEARLQKALTLMELKKSKEAFATLDEITNGSQAARAHYWRGVLFSDQSDWVAAERAFRASLSSTPDAATASVVRLRLAVVLQRLNRLDDAADQIEPLLAQAERVSENPALIEWAARRRFDQGQFEQAAAAASALAKFSTDSSWRQIGWHWAGASLFQLDNETEAITCFEKSVSEPAQTREGVESQLLLAELDFRAARFDKATERFSAVAQAASTDSAMALRARAYFGLGECAENSAQFEPAARHYMSVAILFDDPEWAPHSLFRAYRMYEKLGKNAERMSARKELLERFPESSFAKQLETSAP